MNDSVNNIESTINYLSKENPNVKFLCFYPGDTWDFNSNITNSNSFNKYNEDYKKINILPLNEKVINHNILIGSCNKFINTTKKNNNLFPLYKFFNRNNYTILFKLTDLNKTYLFSFDKGLVETNVSYTDKPWCSLSSHSLINLFTSGYGYDSLIIGGRFESNNKGLNTLNKIFKFQAKNYQNIYYNFDNIFDSFFKKIFKTSKIFHKR